MKKLYLSTLISALSFMACTSFLHAQVPENGLVFDGIDDYVAVSAIASDELNPELNLTMECWVYLNEAPSGEHNPHIITRYYSYALTIESHQVTRVYVRTDDEAWDWVDGSTTIVPNKWYHLAATYDGITLRVFVNGIQEGTTTVNDTLSPTSDDLRIGARNTGPNSTNLNGMMEEVRIWNITRTQTQIQNTMNHTIPGSTPGLVGYWRFDESSGTNANDQTSYNNDGSLQNMSTPSAWVTSTAPIGEASIFAESSDITETSACDVDVDFRPSPEGPDAGHSMAVMQVNELPNSVSGLYPDRAQLYWEIWSEDPDFDGNFTADVRFHYDDISGIQHESSLELFRRDDANGTWSPVSGFIIVTNDGGSSTTTDGIGYVELPITEDSPGDFSGQYILSWSNEPPVVSDIPDQSVAEGTAFTQITLDNYVDDPDNADDEITWTVTGEDNVTVTITGRVATITADDPEWNGTDLVTFTAEDPEGGTDSDQVNFEVTPVNDPPVVSDIPGEEVAEGTAFATITLDNFVTDIDNAITTMTWTATGQSNLAVNIAGRVATITVNDPDWNGSETITFQAEDPDGDSDSDQATFTVTPVNDLPVVSDIPNEEVAEGTAFATINLDDYVADVDDADNTITWTATGQSNLTVDITARVATITANDPDWNGNETITFQAEDPDGETDSDQATFTVTPVNDPPVVDDIGDQEVAEGAAFATITLDDFVTDIDDADNTITWTATGQSDLTVDITDRVATITVSDPEWNGNETITFQAEDPDGETDSDQAIFTVTPVNDTAVIDNIPNQTIEEGGSFTPINLDDYVTDADDADNTLTWTVTGDIYVTVDITDRVATITVNDPEWNGWDNVTFTVEDPGGLQVSDLVRFTVTAVNDLPVVADIPDQTIAEGQSFSQIALDDFVADADHIDDSISWTAIGQSDITVSIVDRVATFKVDPEWNGSETIVFIAEDSLGGQGSDTAVFTVTPVNDPPVVSDIPDMEAVENENFLKTIDLDVFVADIDNLESEISWTVQGDNNVAVSVLSRVVYITPGDDPEWNGSDTLILTATDPLGASDTDTSIITVTPLNDQPTLSKAIPDTSAEAGKAFTFVLDTNTFTDIDLGDSLVYSASISKGGSTPGWITFDPASRTFSGTPADADKGMVEVIVTATDDSSTSVADTFNIEVKSYVGIGNPLADLEIKLYPNPNSGRFVIESDLFELKDVVLEIFNEKGQLIWNREIKDETGTLRESIDLNDAPDGLYLLRVRNKTGMINKRFIIAY